MNYFFLTDTGLSKSILDATAPIVELLKSENVHNYDLQRQGTDYKVMLPCVVLSNDQREETKVSLYRANGRADTRFGLVGLIISHLLTKSSQSLLKIAKLYF